MTSPDPTGASGRQRLAQLRIISFACIGVIPLLAVMTLTLVPWEDLFAMPTGTSLTLPIAMGAAAAVGIRFLGNRVTPLPPTMDRTTAQRAGVARFQSTFFLRLAFAEMPAFVGLVSVFLGGQESAMPFFIGAAFALVLHLLFAVPNATTIARVERALDAQGGRSHLSAAFGVESRRGPTAADGYTGGATLH